jgi:hypothetical protein
MWSEFLQGISSVDPEFTFDDISEWSTEDFDTLIAVGFLHEIGLATHVTCDACPEAHWEPVRWSRDGKRAFISCPSVGTVDVILERLRRWRASPGQLSTWLAKALALSGQVQPLPESRLWFLGRGRVAGRTPYFFFAAIGPRELASALTEIRQAYGRVTGVLLLPFAPAEPVETAKLQLADLCLVVSLRGGRLTADFGFIEDQLADTNPTGAHHGSQSKKTSPSLAAHRRAIMRAFMTANSLVGMDALARRLGVSKSALHGMARGDKTRYRDDTLNSVLKKIGCPRSTWDRAPKLART